MYRKFYLSMTAVLLVSFVLAACGGVTTTIEPISTEAPAATEAAQPTSSPPTTAPETMPESTMMLPEVDPGALSGNIVTAGSSTVFPLSERMAERFRQEGFTEDKGTITIDSIGSGAGYERFCKTGETDISNASRAIKQSEIDNCAAINRTPIEFRVGTDAIAVVVSNENDFLTDVTIEELALIFSSDAVKWSDVRPEWPSEDILRFSPGTDSGTFDFFVEAVMTPAYGSDNDADKNAILNAPNSQFSEDDNVLVQGVEGSPYAIGYFGFAYFNENKERLNAISIDGVAPSADSAESGEYALARPLFIYSDAAIMQSKPQVAGFINYYLTYVNNEILDVGYFPASEAAINQAKQAWLDAMK